MNRIFDWPLAIAFFALISAVPAAADPQNAKALFDKMLEAEAKRAQGVSDYAMDITMMGHDTTLFYERVSIPVAGGKPIATFRLVSFDEMKKRQQAGQGMPPDAWQAYSEGLRQTGSAVSDEMNRGMKEAGLPPGMLDGDEAEPWASPNPSTMMSSMAVFTESAGSASTEGNAAAEDSATAESMMRFRKQAKIVGKERIGKRTAVHVRGEDLNVTEEADGKEITINAISLWMDSEKYVPLKMRMDGVMTQGRESQDIFIERLDDDYRTVPDSKLYMPYRNVMRMAGLLGPKERKEMEEARKQLEDFDKQLASMSPEQRAMVENTAGSQIEMLRKMVESGDMTVVTTVRAIRVNTGLSGAFTHAPPRQPTASDAAPTRPGASASPSAAPATTNDDALEEAQAVCLQQKIDAAKKKKRAFGSVIRAAANTASRYGGAEVSREVEKASQEAYKVDATGKDVEEAAKALGLSTEDVESCRNPK